MARQSVDECFVAVGCSGHVAHSVGDLVDLPPDLAGGLEHYDVELDVEALDRRAHARRAGSDHDHIVKCVDVHGTTLWPGPGRVGGVPVSRSPPCKCRPAVTPQSDRRGMLCQESHVLARADGLARRVASRTPDRSPASSVIAGQFDGLIGTPRWTCGCRGSLSVPLTRDNVVCDSGVHPQNDGDSSGDLNRGKRGR